MERSSSGARSRWAWAAACLALIYLSVPFVLPVSRFLRRNGMLLPSLALLTLLLLTAFYRHLRRRAGGSGSAALGGAALVGFLYLGAAPFLRVPEEWVHLPEYGALGFLLHEALKADCRGAKRLAAGATALLLAGLGEELLQGISPERLFAWRDVFLNLAGGIPPFVVLLWWDSGADRSAVPAGGGGR